MTVGSIEQAHTSGTRPGTETNGAGDDAGLFAMLMATLGVALQPVNPAGNAAGDTALLTDPSIAGAGSPATPGIATLPQNAIPCGAMPTVPTTDIPTPGNLVPARSQADATLTPGQPIGSNVAGADRLTDVPKASAGPEQAGTPTPTIEASNPTATASSQVPAPPEHSIAFALSNPVSAPSDATADQKVSAAPRPTAPAAIDGQSVPAPSVAQMAGESKEETSPQDPASVREAAASAQSTADGTARGIDTASVTSLAVTMEPAHPAPSPTVKRMRETSTTPAAVSTASARESEKSTAEPSSEAAPDAAGRHTDHHMAGTEQPSNALALLDAGAKAEHGADRAKTMAAIADHPIPAVSVATPVDDGSPLKDGGNQINAVEARSSDSGVPSHAGVNTDTAPVRPEPQAPHAATAERVALQHVSAHITRAIAEGTDRLSLQLAPAELGRIDIALDVRDDGQVHAAVRADNPATLDLLQRDARNLERALESAGLRAEPGSLSFSLRNDGRQNQTFNPFQRGESDTGAPVDDAIPVTAATDHRVVARGLVDLTI